jgi:hypothetical protein
MGYKITRRRFGQLAIASTTVAGLSYFTSKTLAQTPSLAIVGVRPSSPTSADTAATDVGIASIDTGEATTSPSNSQQLVVQSLDLGSTQVQDLTAQSVQNGATATVENDEEITGFTYLADGTLVTAVTPVRTGRRGSSPTRLKFLGNSRSELTISGLNRQEELGSLLGTTDGKLLGIIMKKNGARPMRLVEVNLTNGNISERFSLPEDQWFSNLAQCPDGKIYTNSADTSGAIYLVQLDLGQGRPINQVQLRFNNTAWNSNLASLVCSSAGQLLGFGAPRYVQPNSVYTIDASSGALTKLSDFDVSKIALRST